MNIFSSIADLKKISGPIVLVGGTFDGVHLGHQALISSAKEEAKNLGGSVVVMTFDQHPASFLRPEKAPKLLTNTSQKIELLKKLEVKNLLLLPFNAILAATPAEQFIEQLVISCALKTFCVGADWSFGQGGKGNLHLLQQLGKKFHFSAITISPIQVENNIVSSTRIRNAIALGNFKEAAACLGRPYQLVGKVIQGAGRGKELGFPTANLEVCKAQLPPNGVYAVIAFLEEKPFQAVANIGCRPTVDVKNASKTVEVHLLNFNEDLYQKELGVEFISFIREEQKFSSLDILKNQIACDIEVAKKNYF